jgi:hypothetical protein
MRNTKPPVAARLPAQGRLKFSLTKGFLDLKKFIESTISLKRNTASKAGNDPGSGVEPIFPLSFLVCRPDAASAALPAEIDKP